MALYKSSGHLRESRHEAFDAKHRPGSPTPHSGIYRCTNCGDEIAANAGNPLPPQNHRQHNTTLPIEWQLIVYAEQHN